MSDFAASLAVIMAVLWVFAADAIGTALYVRADPETGMQYLVTPFGGITPRMDAEGNQMREGGS